MSAQGLTLGILNLNRPRRVGKEALKMIDAIKTCQSIDELITLLRENLTEIPGDDEKEKYISIQKVCEQLSTIKKGSTSMNSIPTTYGLKAKVTALNEERLKNKSDYNSIINR